MKQERTEMVTIRLTTDEYARAEAVAEHYSLNVAALFRMLVKEEARTTGVESKIQRANKIHERGEAFMERLQRSEPGTKQTTK